MNYNTIKNYVHESIYNKINLYIDFINSHNIEHKLFDNTKNRSIDLFIYFAEYFLFESVGISYEKFFMLLNLGYYFGKYDIHYPKKSTLNDFKSKMANLELNKLIHKKHVTNNNKITKTIITDTMFIENKNNSNIVGRSSYYKNKNGSKILAFCSSTTYPLYADVYKGNINDNEIFNSFLKSEIGYNLIKNNCVSKLISDKGMDSIKNREHLINMNCEPIIPKNIRKGDNPEIKNIKINIKNNEKVIRKELMNKQKKLRIKQLNIKKRINLDKNDKLLLKKHIDENVKIVNNLNKIKKERHSLSNNIKLKIRNSVEEFKKENKGECQCKYANNKCLFCDNKCCCVCNVCKTCNKNNSYYLGLTSKQAKIYHKRQKIEHLNAKLNNGRLMVIRDKNPKMFLDSIYCRFTDFIFFK